MFVAVNGSQALTDAPTAWTKYVVKACPTGTTIDCVSVDCAKNATECTVDSLAAGSVYDVTAASYNGAVIVSGNSDAFQSSTGLFT